MDITQMNVALNSFKTAKEIIKTLMELKEFASHQSLLIDLNSAVISAQAQTLNFQAENATLIAEKSKLEKELMQLKTWDAEKQRYELQQVASGIFAHVIKKDLMQPGEPVHWLCSQCYQESVKAILQLKTDNGYQKTYSCHRCKNEIHIQNPNPPEREPPRRIGGWESNL